MMNDKLREVKEFSEKLQKYFNKEIAEMLPVKQSEFFDKARASFDKVLNKIKQEDRDDK